MQYFLQHALEVCIPKGWTSTKSSRSMIVEWEPWSPCPQESCSYMHMSTDPQNPQHEQKIALATSLLTVQLHMPNRNFVTMAATLVTVAFWFHNSALFCSILYETFDMLQKQETLHFRYKNLGLQVQFQTSKSNCSWRQGCTCKMMLLYQFLLGMDWACLKREVRV